MAGLVTAAPSVIAPAPATPLAAAPSAAGRALREPAV
jgi:hypothetical protein